MRVVRIYGLYVEGLAINCDTRGGIVVDKARQMFFQVPFLPGFVVDVCWARVHTAEMLGRRGIDFVG